MSPAISVVLFDLDDTLTDAAQFGATVLADAAKRYGYDLEIDAIRAYPGVRYEPQLVQQFHIDPSEAAAIYQAYVRLYNGMMRGALQPQPGASELLHALAARDVRMGLVTNKVEALARDVLAMFGWESLIGTIAGQDSYTFRKPDPRIALEALTILDGRPEAAAFVGDTESDMECARGAQIATVIGMLSTTPGERLTEAGATHLCTSLDEVLAIVMG